VERGHGHAPGSLTFKPIEDGQTIRGKLVGSTQLASGRFAMIDDGLGFSLVPWRPVIERSTASCAAARFPGNSVENLGSEFKQ
jgi:hypothetical protein